ncbi:MAG: T9SS type A sorting domain-containing protein [Bacteroidetes bacterium]|nr:T9SS type A sorting domain-containing protein [Bacteroidota bacterium]
MKKGIIALVLGFALSLLGSSGFAQTTAMDFEGVDCNGNMHHLFADLDAGNAVILEFFMNNCSPCVTAGTKLEALKADLLAEYPGMIKSYAFGFNNTYSCTTINNWVNNNGFSSAPMDSGAAQVAYYGGMGMPTIVILGGGSNHSVLGSPYIGFSTSDTTQMASDIRGFLNTATGIQVQNDPLETVSVFPNPSQDRIQLNVNVTAAGNLRIEMLDLTGRQVRVLCDEVVGVGTFTQSFSTSTLASGSYMIKMNASGNLTNRKVSVVH